MKKYTSLGEILIDYRAVNSMSQADLAALLDVDIRTIIRWEKNETLLKPDKEEELVDITFIPYQVIRNLNAPVAIPVFYDFDIRKYSLSELSKELPNAQWFKQQIEKKTSRLRSFEYEDDYNIIQRSVQIQKHITTPISISILKQAKKLLPELNFIFFDTAGYYSGHSIFLPLRNSVYQKIKNKSLQEVDIKIEDLVDNSKEEFPVYYAYDINGDCNENLFYITGEILSFFKSLTSQYVYASLKSRYDTYKINEELGSNLIWEDKEAQESLQTKAPPRLYEANFKKFLSSK